MPSRVVKHNATTMFAAATAWIHARDDRIDYMPAGGEEVKTLAKKVEGMK